MNTIPADKVSFDNTAKAFSHKTDKSLGRSRLMFLLMNNPFLVKIFSSLTVFAIKTGMPITGMIKKTIFKQFCGGESIDETIPVVNELKHHSVGAILDFSVEGKERDEDFERTKCEVINIIYKAKDNPAIPFTSLKVTGLARFDLLARMSEGTPLNQVEKEEREKLLFRLKGIFQTAAKFHVPVYLDAEESWIQPAIDQLCEDLMREYNKEECIVLNTLQMYRWDRYDYLIDLTEIARKEKFRIGVKLVRGAYWEKENERAARLGYKSPVHSEKIKTDIDFDKAVEFCLRNIDIITMCAGTHNAESTLFLVKTMKELGLPNDHPGVYFSQLFGMSDNITYNLAAEGYNVTKYLPYGPVKSVIPYLIRRAEENTSIAGQMGRELRLISEEMERRRSVKLLR